MKKEPKLKNTSIPIGSNKHNEDSEDNKYQPMSERRNFI